VVEVDTPLPSPFASSLQLGYVAAFMYEGDTPLAERRAQALSLDRSVLAELLGRPELRDLIDPDALTDLELDLQLLTPERKATGPDSLHDALRLLGDLTPDEVAARAAAPEASAGWLEELAATRRALRLRVAGQDRWVAIEDAARYRDALGVALPPGVPQAFLEPVAAPVDDLVARFARTHGPFVAQDAARRLGLGVAVVTDTLARLATSGRVVQGEFRPGGQGREWLDAAVLRRLRRRSLAALRAEIEPAPPEAAARFLAAWQGVRPHTPPQDQPDPDPQPSLSGGAARPGARRTAAARWGPREATVDDVYRVVEQLQGASVPASALERQVLPARLPGYTPALLDTLCASGEVTWAGTGPIGADDGWVTLALAEEAPLLTPDPAPGERTPLAAAVHDLLAQRGALFFRQIVDAVSQPPPDPGGNGHHPAAPPSDVEVLQAVWELVWAGLVTNDTLAPLRALTTGGLRTRPAPTRRRRGPALPSRLGPPAGAGRWSLVPDREPDATRRLTATATRLLARHGVLTRGAGGAKRVPGGVDGA
jgi:ATP-dependent helicase Lhr and Lhr-like helicase